MTPCSRYAPMIGARPGELTADEERLLSEHLAGCDRCQARLADEGALSGLLSEALMAEANRRDFSEFADGVLARIPAFEPGVLSRFAAWARRHPAAAIAAALAPAAVAVALVVYFGSGSPTEPSAALVEVSAEGSGAMILQTTDGPVVLIGSSDREGT